MGLTAFLLGFAGSFHCAAMCSPLVGVAAGNRLAGRVAYHAGRIVMYALMGGVLAAAGALSGLTTVQRIITIAVGILLLWAGLGRVVRITIPLVTPSISRFTAFLINKFSSLVRMQSTGAKFGLGIINGLLPCGLTVLALAYCLGLAGFADGFQFMILFGLGTVPALISGQWLIRAFVLSLRIAPSTFNSILLFFLGSIMIIRGGWMGIEIHGLPSASQLGETITWCIP